MLALFSLAQKYPKLLGLADMAKLKTNQLNKEHLARVADAFDSTVPLTDAAQDALIALLKGRDINDVANLVTSPEAVQDVVTFFRSGLTGLQELHNPAPVEFSDGADLLMISR